MTDPHPSLDPVEATTPAECEQLASETNKAYAAFMDYCRLGPGRSLAKLLDRYQTETKPGPDLPPIVPPTKRLATLKDWSGRFDWQKRVEAWDKAQDEAEQALWEARRRRIREADWTAGESLRKLAAQLLEQTPQFFKTTRRLVKGQNGAADREVITLALDQATLFKAIELASKLQRQAAELYDVHRMEHSGIDGGEIPIKLYGSGFSPDDWDDDDGSDTDADSPDDASAADAATDD
ncbi:MAG TPA: hypothetical protein PKD09_10645 [Aggregatilinea sp.]|uniref:hypothetical protein n=1 Tax=Aggregatilinea sp. TaxID=2806333 RepID=UPI002CAE8DDC|nr:hypothetical protein [Aggregatilinea sp.]HML22101.1 hypothetical protein [Aggregatilinea sp.]